MNEDNLAIYLNDHLAGSVAGLAVIDHLCDLLSSNPASGEIERIRIEVAEDRQMLEAIIDRLGIDHSRLRKASAWMAEKAAELKMAVDDPQGGAFRAFELLETLSLGIEGKRSLWAALIAVSEGDARLDRGELDTLITRAEDQRRRVETLRIDAAVAAFRAGAS